MPDGYFVSTTDVEQVEMLTKVHRRTMATTDEAMLCQFFLEKDGFVPTHHHMNDQVGYVVSGKIEMTIGTEMRVLTKSDTYAIPGGIPHSAKALEDSWIVDVFSPPREDYRTEAR